MAFVGIGIDDLDLAFLDIDKAIHRLAGPREKRTRRIGGDLARRAQRLQHGMRPAGFAASGVNRRQSFPCFRSSSMGPALGQSTILGDTDRFSRAGR